MVNIIITEATTYLGEALSQSLVRSGDHRVFGLARIVEKAASLTRDEVIPVQMGSTSFPFPSLPGAKQDSFDILALIKKAGANRLEAVALECVRIPKLGFIYGAGTWVHGSSELPVNDLMPVGALNAPMPSAQLTSWRPKLAQAVLAASDVLDVMVIRPAVNDRRSCAIWSTLFGPFYTATQNNSSPAVVAAELDSQTRLVHVDDVATGFHGAIDKLPMIFGTSVYPVFDLVTS